MIKLHDLPVLWTGGAVREATPAMAAAREKTMACRILRAHNRDNGDGLLPFTRPRKPPETSSLNTT